MSPQHKSATQPQLNSIPAARHQKNPVKRLHKNLRNIFSYAVTLEFPLKKIQLYEKGNEQHFQRSAIK